MKLTQSELLARLEAGTGLEDLLEELRPAAESDLLARTRLTRRFDRAAFASILCDGVEGAGEVSFEHFVGHADVEPLARSPGWYRVRDRSRRPGSVSAVEPETARDLHARLFAYFDALGAEADLDRLHHLLAVDADRGERLLRDLFDEADDRFDLTRARDLLQVVDRQRAYLTPTLGRLLSDRALYLNARSLWEDEFYSTGRYFERTDIHQRFEALLDDPERWMLQLYGTGGMGKTMFLRWVVARYCAPEPQRIPVAKIDFDNPDHVRAAAQPWTLLATFAEQLNLQLPGAPFNELLAEVQEYEQTKRPSGHNPYEEKLAEQIPERFGRDLRAVRGDAPVVIILDTLEEALLRYGTDMPGITEALARAHAACGGLRVLFSGRYDLRERVDALADRLGAEADHYHFEPFSDDEAYSYLTQIWRFPSDERTEAVVKQAGGVPFKLALFVDILRHEPHLSADDVRSLPVDLLYLIERIVRRIEDGQVQWALRYGAVPRHLSRTFLSDVMGPFLRQAMAGVSAHDDPTRGLEKIERRRAEDHRLFSTDLLSSPEAEINFGALWDTLDAYASGYSWVTRINPDTFSFHSDVRAPMRALLRGQPIYEELHRAALRYFESQAEGDAWQEAACEAVYHRFQLEGEAAGTYWRQWAQRALDEGNADALHALGSELTRPEYLDDKGRPLDWKDGIPMVDGATLADAYYLLAYSAQGRREGLEGRERERLLQDARDAFERASSLGVPGDALLLGSAERGVLRLLLVEQTSVEELQHVFEEARSEIGSAPQVLDALDIQGTLMTESGRPDLALGYYEEALERAERTGDPRAARFRTSLLRSCVDADRWQRAIEVGEEARAHGVAGLEDVLLLADAYLRIGAPSRTLKIVRQHLTDDSHSVLDDVRLRFKGAEAELARRNPEDALTWCEEGLDALGTRAEGAPAVNEIHGLHLRGRIHAALMEYEAALEDLEAARSRYDAARDIEGAYKCLLDLLDLALYEVGDLRQALDLFNQAEQVGLAHDQALWIEVGLYGTALYDALGEGTSAESYLDSELFRSDGEWGPSVLVRLTLEGLVRRHEPAPAHYVAPLLDALRELDSPLARLYLLAPLRRFPIGAALEPDAGKACIAVAEEGLAAAERLDPLDRYLLTMTAAEVCRVAGDMERGLGLLQKVEEGIRKYGIDALFAWIDLLEGYQRLGASVSEDRVMRGLTGFSRSRPFSSVLKMMASPGDLVRRYKGVLEARAYGRAMARLNLAWLTLTKGGLDAESAAWTHERLIGPQGERGLVTQWIARGLEAEAVYALQHGDVDGGHALLERAASVYRQLHDERHAEDVEARAASLGAPDPEDDEPVPARSTKSGALPPEALPAVVPEIEVDIPQDAAILQVEVAWEKRDGVLASKAILDPGPSALRRGAEAYETVAQFTQGALWEALAKQSQTEIFPVSLLYDCLDTWPGVADELARLLGLDRDDLRTRWPEGALGLHVEQQARALAALPWELGARGAAEDRPWAWLCRRDPPRDEALRQVRFAQQALSVLSSTRIVSDGIMGPQTSRQISSFQAREELPASGHLDAATRHRLRTRWEEARSTSPSVLLLRAPTQNDLASQRSVTTVYGRDILARYLEARIVPDAIATDHIESLETAMRAEQPPAIIHLAANLRESRSLGAVYLDFQGEADLAAPVTKKVPVRKAAAVRQARRLTASVLRALLQHIPPDQPKPLVILDPPRPPGRSELVRQLFLRNLFAAELFALDVVPAVLATGLVTEEDRHEFEDALVHHVSGGSTLGRFTEQVQRGTGSAPEKRLDEDLLDAAIGPAATALFSIDPDVF